MKQAFLAVFLVFLFAAAAFAAVNLNTASKEELNSLSGIGPKRADAIIKYRQEKGPFKSVDDLKNVYGIGDKLFERIKGEVMVSMTETAASDSAAEVKPAAEAKAAAPAPQPEKKPAEKAVSPQPVEEKKDAAPPVVKKP